MKQDQKLFADKLRAVIKKEGITQKEAYEWLKDETRELAKRFADPKYEKCMAVSFETFRKMLQGRYLGKRMHVLAEIACYRFENEGVSEKHYTDPKIDLWNFLGLIGVNPEPRPAAESSSLRLVHKVIFLVKARGADQLSRILCYISWDWQGALLLPNTTPPTGDNPEATLCRLLAERLGIADQGISLTFRPDDPDHTTDVIKDTGDPNKSRSSGNKARYLMHYCPVEIAEPAAHMLQPCFEVGGVRYKWATLGEMKADRQTSQKNFDVLEFLGRRYDTTLFHLPESFKERINTGS